MNETHEPSYYEIALTNRQVMVVFVVLLLSVIAAFLSGVWVGNDRSSEAVVVAERTASSLAAAEEGDEIRSLNFFTDDEEAEPDSPLRPVAEEPRAGTTLLEDVARSSPGGAVPPIVEEPTPEPPRAEARPAPPAERRVEAPAPTERPARREPPPPTRIASTPPAPADGFVVQVFSSGEEAQAARVRDKLQSSGYSAFLSPVVVDRSTMYRVRVGPFGARAEAETAASRVKRDFKYDTWITR